MKIDKELVKHVAKIARLSLTDEELAIYTKDFKDIIKLFSMIDEMNLDEELAIHPTSVKQRFRDDIMKKSLTKKEVFKNSKNEEGGFFTGPKIR